MALSKCSLLLAAYAVSVHALAAPRPEVTPPALLIRQAGLDPLYDGLGQPAEYDLTTLPPISEWPMDTVTKGDPPTTTTTSAGVAASTAAADDGEIHKGDVVISFTDDIAKSFGTAVEDAAAACGFGAKAKKVKRQTDDVLQCVADQATKLSDSGGVLDAAGSEQLWESFSVDMSNLVDTAAPAVAAGLRVLTNAARRNKYVLIATGIVVVGKESYNFAKGLRVPAAGVGPEDEEEDNGKCDPSKEADENSPLCKDPDCLGGDDQICTTGDEEGCPCLPFFEPFVNTLAKEWMDEQQDLLKQASTATSDDGSNGTPKPECDTDKTSQVPYNVFQGATYTKFCADVMSNQKNAFTKVVDVKGDYVPLLTRALKKRTPPPNPDAYLDYRFGLDWTGGDGSCSSDCKDMFYLISQSQCGRTGGEQNIMALEAKVDTGCGIYSYTVTIPDSAKPSETPEIKKSDIHCIPNPGDIKCWKDVHKSKVDETCDQFNNQFPGHGNMLNSDSPNITQLLRDGGQTGSGVTYLMNIGWIPDCTIVDSQNAEKPIPDDQSVIWQNLLKNNYYNCPGNDGLGGWTDVGCLRYGFYPNNAGTFGSPPHPERFFDTMSYCG